MIVKLNVCELKNCMKKIGRNYFPLFAKLNVCQ